MQKKTILGGFLLLIAAFSFLAYQWYCFQYSPMIINEKGVELKLEPGSGLRHFLTKLSDAQGVLERPFFFFEPIIRIKGDATKLKAGLYEFAGGSTPAQVLSKVVRGDVSQVAITLIEGWTMQDALNHLKTQNIITHTLGDLLPSKVMEKLGVPKMPFEGMFFPDTYYFPKGTTDVEFLKRAMKTMHKHLFAEWEKRDAQIAVKTPYEALILASIIEKESVVDQERPIISGVLHRRLDKKMRLQVDPTVIYGLGKKYTESLTKADLTKDSPFNTYLYAGLPPTPIALPSLSSIQAALHPKAHDYLYFVAKGDGTHVFSATLKEHNQAVQKYIRNK